MVRAPDPEDEDRRRICRERKVLIAERVRHVNRVKVYSSRKASAVINRSVRIAVSAWRSSRPKTGASYRDTSRLKSIANSTGSSCC